MTRDLAGREMQLELPTLIALYHDQKNALHTFFPCIVP